MRRARGPSSPIDRPQAGTFKTKQGGRWVPALVWSEGARDPTTLAAMDRAPRLRCVVAGEERDVERVWTSLHPIDARTYELLCKECEGVTDTDLHTSPVRL